VVFKLSLKERKFHYSINLQTFGQVFFSAHLKVVCAAEADFRIVSITPRPSPINPFESRMRHLFCKALQTYNLPAARARELFKPSTDSASPLVEIEENVFRFRFGVFWR